MRKSTVIAICLVNSKMISSLAQAESAVRNVLEDEFVARDFSEWNVDSPPDSITLGSYYGNPNGALGFVHSPSSGTAMMRFDAWWYSNGGLYMVANPNSGYGSYSIYAGTNDNYGNFVTYGYVNAVSNIAVPLDVKDIVFLLDQGEERLIEGVQRGTIPLTTALEIARANENASTTGEDGQANLGDLLQEAYENGQLKGRQIIEAKRLIEKRLEHGPASPNRDQIKPPTSSYSLVRTYQREVERQRKMVLKAEHAHQRLLLVVQGLKKLFADEHFVNLLRAEGLDTLPKYLAERINTLGAAANPITPEPEGATT